MGRHSLPCNPLKAGVVDRKNGRTKPKINLLTSSLTLLGALSRFSYISVITRLGLLPAGPDWGPLRGTQHRPTDLKGLGVAGNCHRPGSHPGSTRCAAENTKPITPGRGTGCPGLRPAVPPGGVSTTRSPWDPITWPHAGPEETHCGWNGPAPLG